MKPIALLLVALLSACGESGVVKSVVLKTLKDPDSAKFSDVTVVSVMPSMKMQGIMGFACVSVNAKNSFGGYAGEKHKLLVNYVGTWDIKLFPNHGSHEACVKYAENYGVTELDYALVALFQGKSK